MSFTGYFLNELQPILTLTPNIKVLCQDGTNTSQYYTINLLENYLNITNRINTGITTHINEVDPHGDRAYASTLMNQHNNLLDPHGHKNYTDDQLILHSQSVDPHGDRNYSFNLLQTHLNDTNAHNHKSYTDSNILSHNLDLDAHDIDLRIENSIDDIRGAVDGFPELDSSLKIPIQYLPNTIQEVNWVYTKPTTGVVNLLYADLTDSKLYYWNSNTNVYVPFNSIDIGGIALTTDQVSESLSNPNRRYFTSTREATINSNINSRINAGLSLGGGTNVFKDKVGSTLNFKTLIAGDGIDIVDATNTITIQLTPNILVNKETEFVLQGRTNPSLLTSFLTTDGNALDTINYTNTIPYDATGLTIYEGTLIVNKVKQGSTLEQLDKYNKIVETKLWKIRFSIRGYYEWVSPGPLGMNYVDLVEDHLEILTSPVTNTGADFNILYDTTFNVVKIEVTSPNDANHVYLWKADLKRTYIEHDIVGVIDHE